MKNIFIVDWSLMPTGLAAAITGIKVHVASEGTNHEIWHQWSLWHVMCSLLFLICIVMHVKYHWGWYKLWFRNIHRMSKSGDSNRKSPRQSKVTKVLTILMAAVIGTGVALLFIEGPATSVGKVHYILGLILVILCTGHTVKRFRILKKSLPPKN